MLLRYNILANSQKGRVTLPSHCTGGEDAVCTTNGNPCSRGFEFVGDDLLCRRSESDGYAYLGEPWPVGQRFLERFKPNR